MRLDEYLCAVCDKPLPDDHNEWHSLDDGGDCHGSCCPRCAVPIHEAQGEFFAATGKPSVSLDALREATRPRSA